MSVNTLSNLLIIVGLIWIVAGYFTYMQTVKTNKIVNELGKKASRLYSGKNSGFPNTRRIIFAATTDAGVVVDARIIVTAIVFKPMKELPFDELVGKNLNSLNVSAMNQSKVMEKALNNLLKDFKLRNKLKK